MCFTLKTIHAQVIATKKMIHNLKVRKNVTLQNAPMQLIIIIVTTTTSRTTKTTTTTTTTTIIIIIIIMMMMMTTMVRDA